MKKIKRPKGLIGVNGKMPIAIDDILTYLPGESGFVDTRHWVWGGDKRGLSVRGHYKNQCQHAAVLYRVQR